MWDQRSISIVGDVRTLHGGHLVVLANAPPVNRSHSMQFRRFLY